MGGSTALYGTSVRVRTQVIARCAVPRAIQECGTRRIEETTQSSCRAQNNSEMRCAGIVG